MTFVARLCTMTDTLSMTRVLASVCCTLLTVLLSLSPAAAQVAGPLADLQARLSAMAARAPGEVGVAIRDIDSGLGTSWNAGQNMPAASTIKIPVMVEASAKCSSAGLA